MKISQQTMAILKNFQTINKSLLFVEGNELRTISEAGTMFAIANIEETIPKRAGIWELARLMAVLSLYEEPILEFGETSFIIKDGSGKKKTSITYTEPELILSPPEGKIPKINEADIRIKFELGQEDFMSIIKTSSSLDLQDFVVKTEDGILYVGVTNVLDRNSNNFFIEMGEVDTEMFFVIDIASLKFMNSSYIVTIDSRKVVFDSGVVRYFLAVDSSKSKI